MPYSALTSPSLPPTTPPRRIVGRTKGQRHGPVTRLISPGDLGELLKPFVFLDLFSLEAISPVPFGMHPHSGIATLTTLLSGDMQYQDRHGIEVSLEKGGVEWLLAGGGVWHGSPLRSRTSAQGFQLWLALPADLEEAPPKEMIIRAEEISVVGPARVLLGNYQGVYSSVRAPSPMTYLHVTLQAQQRWVFATPEGHTVCWIAVHTGAVESPERVEAGELAIFEESGRPIVFHATETSEFILGSAVRHPHDLVTGNYSVHTNAASLSKGEARIVELGTELRRSGRLS